MVRSESAKNAYFSAEPSIVTMPLVSVGNADELAGVPSIVMLPNCDVAYAVPAMASSTAEARSVLFIFNSFPF